jgi:transcriptional regulator GlxA family with amidase domain
MAKAEDLVATTDLPFQGIGVKVGIPDPHYSREVFKPHFGMSRACSAPPIATGSDDRSTPG